MNKWNPQLPYLCVSSWQLHIHSVVKRCFRLNSGLDSLFSYNVKELWRGSLGSSGCPVPKLEPGWTQEPGRMIQFDKPNTPFLSLPVSPGEPQAPNWVLTIMSQHEQTSSTLQLVANDMTNIMEKLDTRELDLGDGEYDTTDTSSTGV